MRRAVGGATGIAGCDAPAWPSPLACRARGISEALGFTGCAWWLSIGLFYVCVARAHHFIVSDVDFRMSYVYVVVVLTVVRAVVLFLLELLPNHNRTPPIDIRRKQDAHQ